MRAKKVQVKQISDPKLKNRTFLRRRNGLFKKAHELAVMCDLKIAIVMFDEKEMCHIFGSDTNETDQLLNKYMNKSFATEDSRRNYEIMPYLGESDNRYQAESESKVAICTRYKVMKGSELEIDHRNKDKDKDSNDSDNDSDTPDNPDKLYVKAQRTYHTSSGSSDRFTRQKSHNEPLIPQYGIDPVDEASCLAATSSTPFEQMTLTEISHLVGSDNNLNIRPRPSTPKFEIYEKFHKDENIAPLLITNENRDILEANSNLSTFQFQNNLNSVYGQRNNQLSPVKTAPVTPKSLRASSPTKSHRQAPNYPYTDAPKTTPRYSLRHLASQMVLQDHTPKNDYLNMTNWHIDNVQSPSAMLETTNPLFTDAEFYEQCVRMDNVDSLPNTYLDQRSNFDNESNNSSMKAHIRGISYLDEIAASLDEPACFSNLDDESQKVRRHLQFYKSAGEVNK